MRHASPARSHEMSAIAIHCEIGTVQQRLIFRSVTLILRALPVKNPPCLAILVPPLHFGCFSHKRTDIRLHCAGGIIAASSGVSRLPVLRLVHVMRVGKTH
jgi:hypothetical protein